LSFFWGIPGTEGKEGSSSFPSRSCISLWIFVWEEKNQPKYRWTVTNPTWRWSFPFSLIKALVYPCCGCKAVNSTS
jgi:hypothetical protein